MRSNWEMQVFSPRSWSGGIGGGAGRGPSGGVGEPGAG